MIEYVITKRIKIPTPRQKYPFSKMDVGHSFAFSAKEKRKIQSAAFEYGKTHNVKFTVNGFRIWRIE